MQSLDPAVFSVAQVARILGLSRSSAYARIQDGTIPSIKIGGRVLVPKRLIERLLDGAGDHTDTLPNNTGHQRQ